MKQNAVPFVLFLFVVACMGSCLPVVDREDRIPKLLERKTLIGPDIERTAIRNTYNTAVAALNNNPEDLKQYVRLASAFIMEGKVTGNSDYYSNAAVKVLNRLLLSEDAEGELRFQALNLKSVALLNMRQFNDALTAAKLGLKLDNGNASIYGVLVDACVALGHYNDAAKYCEKMVHLRGDLRSYSRASNLRQINGDNRGAIAEMRKAIDAGVPGAESTEGARVTLGDLYLTVGRSDSAMYMYEQALIYRPGYPYAEMGLARAMRFARNYDDAIVHVKNAMGVINDVSFTSFLGDLYALKGDSQKAAQVHNDIVTQLLYAEHDQPDDVVVKPNASRELAIAYMNIRNYEQALSYARSDLELRPNNIEANELVAWILYLKGNYKEARLYASRMLHMNTQDPAMLYKASLIYFRAGEPAKSSQLRVEAMKIAPFIEPWIWDVFR